MTLRARVLIGTVAVALVLGVSALVIATITRNHLIQQVDDQLASAGSRGQFVSSGLGPGPGGGRRAPVPSAVYVGVYQDGSLLGEVPADLGRSDRPAPVVDDATLRAHLGPDDDRPFTVGTGGSSLRYRMLVVAHDGRADQIWAIGLPLEDVDETMDRLVLYEGAATVIVLAVLGLVTFWVIHLGVRPIKAMTATASAIAGGDLSDRVPPSSPGTEAHDLGEALNGMLGRLEVAFDERTRSEGRLRQFVGDASHELRTPITTIRGYAELYRAGALAPGGQLEEAMRRTEQEAVRMGNLVDDLLHLARLDQGRPLRQEPLDLAALVRDAGLDAGAVAPDRTIAVTAPSPLVVRGDEDRLRQVLANLVGNALVHTAPGTPIEVTAGVVTPAPTHAVHYAEVSVTDHGPGMPAEVAERAFERFYRADPSRSRHRGGSGLGLAIVHATVEALGGRVDLASTPGAGTVVRVLLPLAGDPAPVGPAAAEPPAGAPSP